MTLVVFSFRVFDILHTPAVTTTTIELVCPACGIIKKSGKASCCGHGGSWFGNCGSAGNANLGHTWHEGIRVCETQFQAAVGKRRHAFQTQGNAFSDDASLVIDSKAVVMAARMFASTSAITSTPIPGATPITVHANTSTITADSKSIAYYTVAVKSKAMIAASTTITHDVARIAIILIIVCWY